EPRVALHHERRAIAAGHDVRPDRALEHRQSFVERKLPEGLSPLRERIAAPDVVDEDVEPPFIAPYALEQGRDFLLAGVIDAHRDPAATVRSDHLRRLIDGLGAPRSGPRAARAATGAVHGRTGLAEHARDATTGTAGGAGDDGDLSLEGRHLERR